MFIIQQYFITTGAAYHSRWLTTAVQFLALYTRTINPRRELKIFIEYIQNVPMWFSIKKSKSFVEGPKLISQFIQLISMLDSDVQDITLPIIQRKSFRPQPGNLVAALLYSEEHEHRLIAVGRIWKLVALLLRKRTGSC